MEDGGKEQRLLLFNTNTKSHFTEKALSLSLAVKNCCLHILNFLVVMWAITRLVWCLCLLLPLLCSPSQHKDAESYFGKCRKITGQIKCVWTSKKCDIKTWEENHLCWKCLKAPTSVCFMESGWLPAVDHHRPSVRRCWGLDPAQKSQQAGSVVGHPVLRPGGEVELAHLMFSRVTSLEETVRFNEMLLF